jgi:hypothetical protein
MGGAVSYPISCGQVMAPMLVPVTAAFSIGLALGVFAWPHKPQPAMDEPVENRGAELVSVVWRTNLVTVTNWVTVERPPGPPMIVEPNAEERAVMDAELKAWGERKRN